MKSDAGSIEFERHGPVRRALKAAVINPIANYVPASLLRALLKFGKSELAASNWTDPGGWRSMVISYEGRPRKMADRILVTGGTISMALRNRRRLAAKLIADLIGESSREPAHVLCLGAGPGHIIMDAMLKAPKKSVATLVDLSCEAFEYGKGNAKKYGLSERIRFIQGDVRDVTKMLEHPPDVVKMLGICEYLTDEQIVSIASAAAAVMPAGASFVFNSLSKRHGTDRFFRRVLGLNMTHRTPEQLQGLMRKAGLDDFTTHAEPLGVFHVIVGRRKHAAKGK